MRRLSLLAVAILLSLVGTGGAAAHAATFSWRSADASASIRQGTSLDGDPGDADSDGVPDSSDKCPSQPGTRGAQGCPDEDGDSVGDPQDKCPTQAGYDPNTKGPTPDGCPLPPDQRDSVGVSYYEHMFSGSKSKTFGAVYVTCTDPSSHDGCKPQGTVTLTVTAAARRMLKLSSAVVSKGDISHPCGAGTTCAYLGTTSAVRKKLNAWIRKKTSACSCELNAPLPGKLTFDMTFPKQEKLSTKVDVSSSKNLRFSFGAGFPAGGLRKEFN